MNAPTSLRQQIAEHHKAFHRRIADAARRIEPPPAAIVLPRLPPHLRVPRPREGQRYTVAACMKLAAGAFGVPVEALASTVPRQVYVRPRQVSMWLARRYTVHSSMPMLGRQFRRDHTTVWYGLRRIDAVVAHFGIACGDDPVAWAAAFAKLSNADWRAVRDHRRARTSQQNVTDAPRHTAGHVTVCDTAPAPVTAHVTARRRS